MKQKNEEVDKTVFSKIRLGQTESLSATSCKGGLPLRPCDRFAVTKGEHDEQRKES